MIFGFWGMFAYIAQFLLINATINAYSDVSRLIGCAKNLEGEDASNVYDNALILLASYHLVEWFRIIVFLTAVFLGANMIYVYYAFYINTLFGIAAYCVCHAARYNSDGKTCADYQNSRASVLVAEVVIFWTTYLILSFP